jgi:hypothetical protein
MADNNDMPRTRTIEPIDPPPDSENPTSAMLKGDIDSGRTGDKVAVFDPGLSPLGTDDEAAGHPPSAFRVALARYHEVRTRWSGSPPVAGAAHDEPDGALTGFLGFIGAVALVLAVGIAAF